MLRALIVGSFFFTATPLLIVVQWLIEKLKLPGAGWIGLRYYRLLCGVLRINVRVVGKPVHDRPVLFVSNHTSWSDIVVIGSILPVAFVAKKEVADWPIVGTAARVQGTVFVDRTRRHQTAAAIAQMVDRLIGGRPVVLFAEGTSNDGNRVLPFRSALIGALEEVGDRAGHGSVLIQPMSISYPAQQGIPMGRQNRPLVAWYGDLDFMPHIKEFVARGAVDAVVSYGEPVAADAAADRKAVTRRLESAVRDLTASSLRGRPLPAPAAS
jgi:lyso-ornithine lipid O-acyltransferase